MIAVRVGTVRRVVVAAPGYLMRRPVIDTPFDLVSHPIIAVPHFGLESWNFGPAVGASGLRSVQLRPRMIVDSMRAAVASAIEGNGVTRVFSYAAAEPLRKGRLKRLLISDEDAPIPVHLVMPDGRLSVPKVRAFVDLAVPRLRAHFTSIDLDAYS